MNIQTNVIQHINVIDTTPFAPKASSVEQTKTEKNIKRFYDCNVLSVGRVINTDETKNKKQIFCMRVCVSHQKILRIDTHTHRERARD